MKNRRIIFMGTPKIASVVLKTMLENDIHVGLVVTQPDKKKGRKQQLVYSEVKEVALEYDIPVFQPVKIKSDYQTILDFAPDLIVTCAYGQIVPKEVLDLPVYGCVNLHGSLLPKYRGGAPIQRAIWNGDKVSGMSLMKMAPKMDAGPVLAQKEIEILPEDNSTSLFEKMGVCASELLLEHFAVIMTPHYGPKFGYPDKEIIMEHFEEICSGKAVYVEQDESQVVFSPILSKEEEHIDLNQDDEHILNQIRAFSDAPGAYVLLNGKKFKILKASYLDEQNEFGLLIKIGKNKLGIGLHLGTLVIETCQMEGKPVMDCASFFNGQGRNLVGNIVE